jgi:quercetin dioxygenase-like cupin family protein
MKPTITLTRPAEAEALWVIRDRIKFLGRVPDRDLELVEVEVPPGSGTPPHRHDSPEVFRILSGEVTFGLPEANPPGEVTATAGTVVAVPSRSAHYYRNAGAGPAVMLVLLDGTMTAFFRDLGRSREPEPGPPSAAEISAVMAACARHRIDILPPSPS